MFNKSQNSIRSDKSEASVNSGKENKVATRNKTALSDRYGSNDAMSGSRLGKTSVVSGMQIYCRYSTTRNFQVT